MAKFKGEIVVRLRVVVDPELTDVYSQDELGLAPKRWYVAQLAQFREQARTSVVVGDRARAILSAAWALEKLGDGAAAIEQAATVRTVFVEAGDREGEAECCHSIAVWAFHHEVVPRQSESHFVDAAALREAAGNPVLAAQSWHNLGYVQAMAGEYVAARASYDQADALLLQAISSGSGMKPAAVSSHRGFVFSHLAYLSARSGEAADAVAATMRYFRHVSGTGLHREAALARMAPGVSARCRSTPPDLGVPVAVAAEFQATTGAPLDPERLLRQAVAEAHTDLAVPEPGRRRAYLGSHLLALAELAAWLSQQGDTHAAAAAGRDAFRRASARGWSGEAGRLRERFPAACGEAS